MKKNSVTFLISLLLFVMNANPAHACFGDKIGIGHLRGVIGEFSAHLIAIYIKEKTGIDSVVNEFGKPQLVESSLKKEETDIIIWTGIAEKLIIDKLVSKKEGSRFVKVVLGRDVNVMVEVSEKRLKDMKFFTLNRAVDRFGSLITYEEFVKRVNQVIRGEKFPKEAAREYLVDMDII